MICLEKIIPYYSLRSLNNERYKSKLIINSRPIAKFLLKPNNNFFISWLLSFELNVFDLFL